jgi:hypothetical protein
VPRRERERAWQRTGSTSEQAALESQRRFGADVEAVIQRQQDGEGRGRVDRTGD